MDSDCDICGQEANLFCKECSSLYCEACSALSYKHPKRRSHQVVTQAEKEKEDEDLPLSQSSRLSQQGEMQIHGS